MAELNDVLIPGLINEMAVLCIARVPLIYHYNLGAVCRSWRDLFHGKALSTMRKNLSLAEEWLYMWLEDENAWHCCFDRLRGELWKLPTIPDNRISGRSAVTSVDEKLFVIGGNSLGSNNGASIPCKAVSYFDTRSWCWNRAADLNVARAKCTVRIIENQVYVFGGYTDELENRTITAETYDLTTDTWKLISNLPYSLTMCITAVVGGKFYMKNKEKHLEGVVTVYDSRTDRWEDVADEPHSDWHANVTSLTNMVFEIRL